MTVFQQTILKVYLRRLLSKKFQLSVFSNSAFYRKSLTINAKLFSQI
jgi:hypothetical protein